MSPHIIIHWIGVRKDSGRGSMWGWFTEVGKPDRPPYRSYHYGDEPDEVFCHVFWGSMGKKMQIEETFLTPEFLESAHARSKNFRQAEAEKVASRWGKNFDEELSMYLMMLKMKG